LEKTIVVDICMDQSGVPKRCFHKTKTRKEEILEKKGKKVTNEKEERRT